MRIFPVVCKDDIRRDNLLHLFKCRFDLRASKRHETVRVLLQEKLLQTAGTRKQIRTSLGFGLTHTGRAKYDPIEPAVRILFDQTKNRASTANLDIVRMSTQT